MWLVYAAPLMALALIAFSWTGRPLRPLSLAAGTSAVIVFGQLWNLTALASVGDEAMLTLGLGAWIMLLAGMALILAGLGKISNPLAKQTEYRPAKMLANPFSWRQTLRHPQLFTACMELGAFIVGAQPASAQYIRLKDFPKIFGTYAAGGDCARLPRVIADAGGIKIVTAAGAAVFQHTDVSLGFNGREDHSTTVFTQGPGEGLIIQFENGELTTAGGDRMGAAEQAVAAIADHGPMRRCGARAAALPPPPAEPAPPKMRATAAASVSALANVNVMTDPGFKAAYLQALGPLQREAWLIDMDGPGDQHVTTAAGGRFLQVTTCKTHACDTDYMLVIYRPQPRALYGVVVVNGGRKTIIGQPPPALIPELLRLAKTA